MQELAQAPEQVLVLRLREAPESLFLWSSMREVWRTAHDLFQTLQEEKIALARTKLLNKKNTPG